MKLNQNQSAANYIQAEWKTGQVSDKLKLIQRAQKLGGTFASVYLSLDELEDMMRIFVDRELKVSFLKGFEEALKTGRLPAATDETKNYIHYETLRNKRA